jgi:hypothetical protein
VDLKHPIAANAYRMHCTGGTGGGGGGGNYSMGQGLNVSGVPQQPGMNFEGMGGQQVPPSPSHPQFLSAMLTLPVCMTLPL